MSIVKRSGSSGHQPPDGFVWNVRISERVLVTLLIVGGSFTSGVSYGQAQAISKGRELPSVATQVTCPTVAKPNVGNR
jgi:hypothetical protein